MGTVDFFSSANAFRSAGVSPALLPRFESPQTCRRDAGATGLPQQVLIPGNANLPIGVLQTANREIGVPRQDRIQWM